MEKQATGTNEAQTHDAGTQTAHTQKAQTTMVCAVCRLRPQGRTAREKAAHNSPRQSAWVECVCGRVCGRLSAFLGWLVWGFGCFLGVFVVFSGFLIFLGCDGCGLFGFVLVRFGWGLLCLMLIVFVVLTRLLIL